MAIINFENIIKSFFLGLFIGLVLQVYDQADTSFAMKALSVLASGSIGFIIGLVTEWLTAMLPISIANARMYFIVNNLIALAVATVLLASLLLITNGGAMGNKGEFTPILLIVLGVICLANLIDYLMYRRAQRKLLAFQASMEDHS